MKTMSIQLSKKQVEELKGKLENFSLRYDIQYTHFQAKLNDGVITAYTSNKVVFNGASAYKIMAEYIPPQRSLNQSMAGSDEVGTGDYFGPITVVACYVDINDEQWLAPLNIMDSKAISDGQILKLGPILQERLTHSLLILDNPKYNKIHQTKNLNAIKAMMHHMAYNHLKLKLGFLPELSVVDQFMNPTRYYQVLEDDYGITNLHFETKAEDKYLAVACASVIARYNFLLAIRQLSHHYSFNFPLGAGPKVDQAGKKLLQQHPNLDLKNVAKVHFKNTARILDSI